MRAEEKIATQYLDIVERGIKVCDDRLENGEKLPKELLEKIREHFVKNYCDNSKDDPYEIDGPYTEVNITNNVHSFAKSICTMQEDGTAFMKNLEGNTTLGTEDYTTGDIDEDSSITEITESPDFDMEKVQIGIISYADSANESKLVIYIPDKEKKEVGSYKKKYGNALIKNDKDVLYSDNIQLKEDKIYNFNNEKELDSEVNKKETFTLDDLDKASRNANRSQIKSILSDIEQEINSKGLSKGE